MPPTPACAIVSNPPWPRPAFASRITPSSARKPRAALNDYFQRTVFPVLTPLAFDTGRPFPHISNLSLNLGVVVRDAQGVERFARVKIPNTLPQLVPFRHGGAQHFVWLEQLIAANLEALFPGLEIVEAHPFHVTRDADVAIQELESDDLLETIEEAVWRRRFRAVIRLQVNRTIPAAIVKILTEELGVEERAVYRVDGPLDLSRLRQLYALDRPDLKYKPFSPHTPAELQPRAKEDIFSVIRREDVLLHHPFDSVPAGGGVHPQRGPRSGRAGHQDDAVPGGPQFADRAGASRRHRGGQAGFRAAGVEGALR